MKVLRQDKINASTYVLWLESKERPDPGQFYMVYPRDGAKLLGRPLSIFDYQEGILGLLYEVRGEGTRSFTGLEEGDEIQVLGPYGQGFHIKEERSTAFIAGGVGLAPFVYFSRFFKSRPKVYFGTQNAQGYEEYLRDYNLDLEIHQGGYITDYVDYEAFDQFYTCGPRVMMEKVLEDCISYDKDLELSMEERMGCGFGACLGCSIETLTGQKRVCKEGPVFRKEDFSHA